ncbi:MAG: hypothetical protein P8124_12185 [Gammaproteobacteria bacterium]
MALGITRFKKLSRFKKAYKDLPKHLQSEVDGTIRDLGRPKPPHGRRLKQMRGYKNPKVWEIRVNAKYRMTFELDGETAVLRNVGPHDILNDP